MADLNHSADAAPDDEALREQIAQWLANGLVTACSERAYDSDAVNATIARLQALPPQDVQDRLVTAGFTDHAYVAADDADGIEQACATCMYFERHRGLCDLPELGLPVKPEWSCILWRI